MKAVAEQTRIVSTKTPIDWMSPCFAGWVTCAVEAALGAEPSPASFENRPRRTPLSMAAAMLPARPPITSWAPKALPRIALNVG